VSFAGFSAFIHARSRATIADMGELPAIVAGIDVWRVPIAWTERNWGEAIRGSRAGKHNAVEL
jgi:hypothetical protein